jgi:hypothetical protein
VCGVMGVESDDEVVQYGRGGGGPASIMGDGQKTLSGGGVVCSAIARLVMS